MRYYRSDTMVAVKVIPEKGIEYSVYEKNGKHRVYFKVNNGSGRPLEVGNYDILEGRFFPARGSTANWNEISKDEDPKALIVIGDSKQVFVGASKTAPAKTGYSSNYGGNNNRDRDIKRGMCFNNATTIITSDPDSHALSQDDLVEAIMELTDALFAEYMKRYGN